jgi:hypothetical protein
MDEAPRRFNALAGKSGILDHHCEADTDVSWGMPDGTESVIYQYFLHCPKP